MTFPTRALAALIAGAALILVPMRFVGTDASPATLPPRGISTTPAVTPAVVEDEEPIQRDPVPGRTNLVSYAVSVDELHGLPPRPAAGTVLDLWVAWEPPVTKKPKIHRLLSDVILEEVVPPLLPDGPHSALLLVRPGQLSDLLYGDRYGSLSVAVPQS